MTRPIRLYSEFKSVVARCPVFFLPDHGAMTGDHWMIRKGPFQFEGLFRVLIIWSYPKEFAAGEHVETVCRHEDFLPTMLECCDVSSPHAAYEPSYRGTPSSWSGRSLAGLLTDDPDDRTDAEARAGQSPLRTTKTTSACTPGRSSPMSTNSPSTPRPRGIAASASTSTPIPGNSTIAGTTRSTPVSSNDSVGG